jgi:hypothetical protein
VLLLLAQIFAPWTPVLVNCRSCAGQLLSMSQVQKAELQRKAAQWQTVIQPLIQITKVIGPEGSRK